MLSRVSGVQLFATLWTVACQALLSMKFSRQEYWSRLPFPSPEYLPNPGTEARSPALQGDTLSSEPPGKLLLVYIDQKSTGHGFSLPLKNSANSSALHELIITAKNNYIV